MEHITRRDVLAGLLEEIVSQPELDDDGYVQFKQLLEMGEMDPLLEFVADEVTEYYVVCKPGRNVLAMRLDYTPDPAEVELYRQNLKVLAKAIRAGLTDFDSLKELKRRFED